MNDKQFREFVEGDCPVFSQLFHYEDIGQVLIHKVNHINNNKNQHVDDNKCAIRLVINYKGNFFSQDTKFPQTQAGYDDRDELFDQIDEKMAYGQGRALMCDLLTMLYPNGLPEIAENKIIV